MTELHPPTAAVDFDGVIAEYHGWRDGALDHGPIRGVKLALQELRRQGYRIVVFSCRDPAQITIWLERHDLLRLIFDVTRTKPIAEVYFDDRAWRVPSNKPMALLEGVTEYLRTQEIVVMPVKSKSLDAFEVKP